MALDPLAQINLITIGAIIVIALVTLFLLRRICLVPLITVMERRAARIEKARAQLAEASAVLASAQLKADQARSAAREEADRMVAKFTDETTEMRRARMAAAAAEAEAILAAGREEILTLRQSEDAKVARELSSSVSNTLTRMIGPVEDTTVRFMVARVLAAKEAR
jgi:F0F1-type ATP synthase membrane subunit b/b'